MAVKAEIGLARLFRERYRWAFCHPRAVLGLQGGSPVRLVALNLDRRGNEMRATILALPLVVFLAVDATAQVVALGTSGTRGVVSSDEAWTTLLERMLRAKGTNVSVSNEGVFGDTSDGLLGRLDSAVPEGTRVVIIECCGNDNKMGRTVANTPGNVTEMVRRVRTRGAEVVFLGPPELGEVASRFGAR
jgi:acyl-CoA thioesterase I